LSLRNDLVELDLTHWVLSL